MLQQKAGEHIKGNRDKSLAMDGSMEKEIENQLNDQESITSAVFENMIRNNNIKADLLLELTQTVAMEKQHQEE